MSYEALEEAVITQLRTLSYYNDGNCMVENATKVFNYALGAGEATDYGRNACIIDYAGGNQSDSYCWTHRIRGFCAVRATESVEYQDLSAEGEQIRTLINDLLGMFYPNNRLGGATLRCELVEITEPFAYSRSNLNWWALFFTLEVDEERTRC